MKINRKNIIISIILVGIIIITNVIPGNFSEVVNQVKDFSGSNFTEEETSKELSNDEAGIAENLKATKVNSKAPIIDELTKKRDKSTKHFLLQDGSYEAFVYNEPVHYFENGEWKDINNALEEKEDYYENIDNDFSVKVAKNSNSNKLITIEKEKYKISWGLANGNNSGVTIYNSDKESSMDTITTEIDNSDEKEVAKQELENTLLTNITSKAEYKEIKKNIDLQYIVSGKKVKENIIYNDKVLDPEISFNLDLDNLAVERTDDTTYLVDKDSKEKVFELGNSFMYDSNGEVCDKVTTTINQKDDGSYSLEINPDEKWMNDEKRAYPIVLDPIVNTELGSNNILDTFVCSNDTDNKYNNMFLRTGNVPGNVGTTETYIQFASLPNLSAGDMVINAKLYLQKSPDYSGTDGQINAYKVTSSWNNKTVTWNTRPSIESRILDTETKDGNWYKWNITKAVKSWYTYGDSNGIALKRNSPSSGYSTFWSSDISDGYSGARPQVYIQYINNSGVEKAWTYQSQDVGRAGTGYVNNYNGNVVFTRNYDSLINFVYNSNDKNTSIGYGPGWRLNLNQRIIEKVISGTTYYEYTDGDGTKQYFYYDSSSSSYKNEINEDLKFKKNSDGSYEITDKDKNSLYFVPGGYLKYIKDKNGNTEEILYNGILLSGVIDSSGRKTVINYNQYGYLVSIVDPAGRETSVGYNGIQLSYVKDPDGIHSFYTYDNSNNLTKISNNDGVSLAYSYNSNLISRVSNISYSASSGEKGQSISYQYGDNETIVTDATGKNNVYQFNNFGNTESIKGIDGSAVKYQYNNDSDKRNRLELESNVQKISKNYLKNHSSETVNNSWNTDYWGKNKTASFQFSNAAAYYGTYSLMVNQPKVDSDVIRQFYNQMVTLEKGKTYTFSTYIKTDGITNNKNKGAFLFINYMRKDGTYATIDSNFINGTNDWNRQSLTFTLPSDAGSNDVYIRCGIEGESGIAYFDNLQLEDGEVVNRYNLIENADFGNSSADGAGWTCNTGASALVNYDGRTCYRIDGTPDGKRNLSRDVNVSGKKGDVFVLSGWGKAQSIPEENRGSLFALDAGIVLTDGTTQWVPVYFNSGSDNWQFTSNQVITKGDYSKIVVYGLYYNNANSAYFDNIQLYKEEYGVSYQYDSKGNIVSTKDLIKQQTNFTYDGNDKLTSVTDPKGNKTTYEYDNNGNNIKSTSSENIVKSFSYDKYGNNITSTISSGDIFIESSNIPSDDGSYFKRTIASNGAEIKNIYSESKGNLDVSINPDEIATYNSYDEMNILLKTSSYSKFKNNKTAETFLINGNTYGDLGSRPIIDSDSFVKDSTGHYTFNAQNGKTIAYNLGISKNKGTMALKFKPYSDGTVRYISFTRTINDGILVLYVNANNKVGLAIRNKDTIWKDVIISDTTVTKNNWASAIVQWKNTKDGIDLTLSVNSEIKNVVVKDFIDFSGGTTYIGTSYKNDTALNGEIEEFRCSSESEDISKLQSYYKELNNGTYKFFKHWDEYYPLRGNTSGINGTKAIVDKGKFTTNNDNTMSATLGRYSKYNNGIRNNSGTISLWMKTDIISTDTRYIFSGNNKNDGLITSYISSDNKIKVAIRDNNKNWLEILSSDNPITKGNWNMITVSWNKNSDKTTTFNLFVDGIKKSTNITTYLDFSGSNIALGQHEKGYSIEGSIDQFIISSSCYSDNEVNTIFSIGRGNGISPISNSGYSYSKDRLTNIITNTKNYNFLYDSFGNTKSVSVGNSALINNNYDIISGVLKDSIYGNGFKISYLYDEANRIKGKSFDNKEVVNYVYDNVGNLAIKKDLLSGITSKYTYDLASRLIKTEDSNGNWFKNSYDECDRTNKTESYINGKLYSSNYEYDKDGKLNNTILPSGKNVKYGYDSIGRCTTKNIASGSSTLFNVKYNYSEGYAGSSTLSISSINNNGNEINYTYDSSGRISTVDNGKKIKYYYDSLGQLSREDNGELNKTIIYSYDNNGNILKVTEYNLTNGGTLGTPINSNIYNYEDSNWKDKLTSYNGKAITYDSIGNILSYNGRNYSWKDGRKLSSINDSNLNISYKYNSEGNRIGKTVNGVTTDYTLDGDNVIYEEINYGNSTDKINYNYSNGELVGFNLNNAEFYYEKNVQRDIIGIIDESGKIITTYVYDSWGKLISISGNKEIGEKNQYRYRGYRYDTETGLYYLNSRYYNPEWGRFINADAAVGQVGNIQGYNMFQYCFNNPVNMDDPSGQWPKLSTIFTVVAVAAAVVAVAAVVVVTAGAAAPALALAGGAVLGGSGAASVAVGAGIVAIGAGVAAVTAKASEYVSDKLSRREHTVYKLTDNSGTTQYVGRTKNQGARKRAHDADGSKTANLNFIPIASNLTYFEARGLEQIAMLQYNTKSFKNSVNGISPNNPRRDIYMAAGRQVAHYIGNQISNEVLYWTGK
ncbi:MAG: DNRLRE domain-containing protein [Clostridiales bacterium]|nr:DNRLRE domain-containing protein [Clostridiales bacterium]